jgi:hypothetical protein
VSGGAGNDTITGLLGTSGTFSVGDNINGGSGTDTLNLIAASSTDGAAGLVSLDGVEVVNIRQLGTAAQALTVNAADWSGVAKLSNASSIAGTLLQVSGATAGLTLELNGDTDLNVDFVGLTSGTDSAVISLVAAGSGSASTALSYSDIDLDLDGSGLLDAATLTLQGNSYVNIKGGDDLRTITVNGSANYLVLKTTATEVITSIDASALNGTNKFFLSGRNDIAVVGGGGNDTFTFGTSLNASDSINGGSGTDTISATLGNSVVRLQATAVEAASLTLGEAAGGELDLSAAQSVTTLTVVASAAGNVATVTNFAGGTANLAGDNIGDITIDTVGSAALSVVIGSATGAVSIASAAVNDAASLTISTIGSGVQTISTVFDVESDVKSLTINTNGSGHLSVADMNASGATSVAITTTGSASATFTDLDVGSAIASFTVNAGGSDGADITFAAALFDGSSANPDTVRINASSGADVWIKNTVQLGTAQASSTGLSAPIGSVVIITAGADSEVGASAASATGVELVFDHGSATVTLDAQTSGIIRIGTADMGDISSQTGLPTAGGYSLAFNASVATAGLINITQVSADDSDITLGAVTVQQSGGFVFGSGGVNLTTGTATFGTITLATAATATIGAIGGGASGGKVTGINVIAGLGSDFAMGAIAASSLGAVSLDLGESATATFGAISTTAVGAISLTVGERATATFGVLNVTGVAGSIGAITATIGSGGAVDFNTLGSANETNGLGSIGAITVTIAGEGSADFGNVATGAGRVGDITLNIGGSASADFANFAQSAIGTIAVSGSGWVDFGTISATTVAGIDLRNQGSGGTFTIDLSGVTNGVVIDGGRGTTTITSGNGNDEFFLKTALGTDTIKFSATGQASDSIYRFEVGTADDVIMLQATGLNIADGRSGIAGSGNSITTDGISARFLNMSAESVTAFAAHDVIQITYTAFSSAGAMLAAIGSGGSADITLTSAINASIAIIWTDGTDSYLSLASATATETNLDDDAAIITLATFAGVDLRATQMATAQVLLYSA